MNLADNKVDLDTLKNLEPISSLSGDRLRELADQTCIEYLEPDVCIFREGESDNQAVYLLSGQIELRSADGNSTHTITAGMPESWHPIAPKQPRQVTAVTTTSVELVRIDLDQLDMLLTWDQVSTPRGDTPTDGTAQPAVDENTSWASSIHPSMAFRSLPAANIDQLFRCMERIEASEGDVIIRQGDAGDYYYLITEGTAMVTRQLDEGGDAIELAELGPGASFGEEALISDNPRNATVTMTADGVLMRLAKEDFNELLREPLVNWISLEDTLNRLETDAQCLDVRLASEFNQGHLPGALNMPLHELRQHASELDKNTHYICYCNTGRRSSAAAFLLSQSGYSVSVLEKGIQGLPSGFLIR